jgi:uncharacterized membrane protein YkvA (DUF1232 family)
MEPNSERIAMLAALKQHARRLKAETYALYLASRHPGTPWYAKLIAGATVAYAFSPIDLIPDFVPVLGYLDDLIIVPLGAALAIRLIPPEVMAECRARAADEFKDDKPVNRTAAAVIVVIWIALAAGIVVWLFHLR